MTRALLLLFRSPLPLPSLHELVPAPRERHWARRGAADREPKSRGSARALFEGRKRFPRRPFASRAASVSASASVSVSAAPASSSFGFERRQQVRIHRRNSHEDGDGAGEGQRKMGRRRRRRRGRRERKRRILSEGGRKLASSPPSAQRLPGRCRGEPPGHLHRRPGRQGGHQRVDEAVDVMPRQAVEDEVAPGEPPRLA